MEVKVSNWRTISLIIQREYLTRVRKRSFLLLTILGPLLIAGMLIGVVYLGSSANETQKILVIDETTAFTKLKSSEKVIFSYQEAMELDQAKLLFHNSNFTAILHIPKTIAKNKATNFFFKKKPSAFVIRYIERQIDGAMRDFLIDDMMARFKLEDQGFKRSYFEQTRAETQLMTINFSEPGVEREESNEGANVGRVFGLIIYFFILMYCVQVMRGVMEEKSSRIVEVIISSVKPFQLMMGKIIGVALVGLTQFTLWIILTMLVFSVAKGVLFEDQLDLTNVLQGQMTNEVAENMDKVTVDSVNINDPQSLINRINFPLMIGMFLFYFMGGYLLYGSLFAAVGAAVDSETDTQQFILPITLPLVFSYIVSAVLVSNPDSTAGVWLSMFPLTSPVVMMQRIAIGINPGDTWQLYVSMLLLIGGFIFTTWVAGKIYRTGILMYGKKVTYKELYKWFKYKD